MASPERFCAKCGSAIPAGAAFCPACGAPASAGATGPAAGGQPDYSRGRPRHEKQEKQEKHEKGEKGEKGRGGDLTGAFTGGMILIWLGVVFFLTENNYVPSGDWWAYLLMGIGAILMLQGALRYAMSRRPLMGPFIGGIVIFMIGLASVQGIPNVWPLLLVAIGVVILASAVLGRGRRPTP